MIASRLRERRKKATVNVYSRTHSGSTYTENTAVYTSIVATHEKPNTGQQAEQHDFVGTYQEITDVFWFEPIASTGLLPSISAGHLITWAGGRYDVVDVTDQAGEGNRLKVETKRLEWSSP